MAPEPFPVGSSVLLKDLVKGAQYNDKKGIVKSRLNSSGRQEVYIFDANKSIAIKPTNLKYEPREISSLSISEMKGLLLVSNNDGKMPDDDSEPPEWKGLDKEQLQSKVAEITTDPDKIAALISKANEPKEIPPSPSPGTQPNKFTGDQFRQGAERMSKMDPDQLRDQAAKMKAMGPAALRALVPQMAQLSDESIMFSIEQMEALANNPGQMRAATEQMKNMSEDQLNMAVGGGIAMASEAKDKNAPLSSSYNKSSSSSSSSSSKGKNTASLKNFSSEQFKQATEKMGEMSPEDIRNQVNYLKSLPMDTLKKVNPQFANMSDDQIRMCISQMEMVASNPDMMKTVRDQMKNMDEEQFESMKQMMNGLDGGLSGGSNDGSSDGKSIKPTSGAKNAAPTPDMSNMINSFLSDPDQLKTSIKMMKDNPDMLKSLMISQLGNDISDESKKKVESSVDQLKNLEDKHIDLLVKVVTFVAKIARPLVNAWNATTRTLNLSSKALFVILNLIVVAILAFVVMRWRSSVGIENELIDTLSTFEEEGVPEIVEGHGDSEF